MARVSYTFLFGLLLDHRSLIVYPLNLDIRVTRGYVLPYHDRPRNTISHFSSIGSMDGVPVSTDIARNLSFKLTKVKDFVSNVMIAITLTMPIVIMR